MPTPRLAVERTRWHGSEHATRHTLWAPLTRLMRSSLEASSDLPLAARARCCSLRAVEQQKVRNAVDRHTIDSSTTMWHAGVMPEDHAHTANTPKATQPFHYLSAWKCSGQTPPDLDGGSLLMMSLC